MITQIMITMARATLTKENFFFISYLMGNKGIEIENSHKWLDFGVNGFGAFSLGIRCAASFGCL
jgi:hypothetical protein